MIGQLLVLADELLEAENSSQVEVDFLVALGVDSSTNLHDMPLIKALNEDVIASKLRLENLQTTAESAVTAARDYILSGYVST